MLVEWSFEKERLNERGSCMLVEWSSANKRNKSMRITILGRMAVHKRENKLKRTKYFVFSFLVLLKEKRTQCESTVLSFCSWC